MSTPIFELPRTIDEESSEPSSSGTEEACRLRDGEPSSNPSEEQRDAPEALVRQESNAIGAIRVLAALLLLLAAAAASVSVFRFSRNVEVRAFQADFRSSADRLTGIFISEFSLRYTMSRALSAAVTLAMESQQVSHTNFSFAPGRMEELASGIMLSSRGAGTSWSPLLRTDEERRQFEAFVQRKEESQQVERCYVCGSPNRTYKNPQEQTDLPGYGSFTCREIEQAGLDGVIDPQFCALVSATVSVDCVCQDLTEEQDLDFLGQVTFPDSLFQYDEAGLQIDTPYNSTPYSPIWDIASAGGRGFPFLYNFYSDKIVAQALDQAIEGDVPVTTDIHYRNTSIYKAFARTNIGAPSGFLFAPVYSPDQAQIVGTVATEYPWQALFQSVEAFSNNPMRVIVENSCGQELSFDPDFEDDSMRFIGAGDFHDHHYEDLVRMSTYEDFETIVKFGSKVPRNQTDIDYCRYRIRVYPTSEHEERFLSTKPTYYSVGSVLIFIFSSFVFGVYDWLVRRRQTIIMNSATKTSNIVTSLFPENVRERLYEQASQTEGKLGRLNKVKLESFAEGVLDVGVIGEPIADLFPSATVMHFDIESFTVWSSERDPNAMFTLLERIYGEFDREAKRMGVYKIETMGDSYIAVCGLPKKNDNHAVIMARFAALCLSRFVRIIKRLEVSLGPSTGDLRARVGLHSGPVVAGVLRGEKARFQLFGDTVNLTSRLQVSCKPMCIQASKNTAALLVDAGYGDWVKQRNDRLGLKGLTTFWVKPVKQSISECSMSICSEGAVSSNDYDDDAVLQTRSSFSRKQQRLVNWNVEMLHELLLNLAADRKSRTSPHNKKSPRPQPTFKNGNIVVDELVTVLSMPKFDEERVSRRKNRNAVSLPPSVRFQLHNFVSQIAGTYRDVPFHNFEHASHVVMSSRKLMKRVIEPDNVDYQKEDAERQIHESTYGISSDPLLLFTVVFSALIHDADHTGLSNGELIAKKDPLAQIYMERSVAEQNSVDMAWKILNEDQYAELRGCIYTNEEELQRFRQLLVNAVIATDIADKSLKSLREGRWDAAFADKSDDDLSVAAGFNAEDSDRRATVIYEYIIQAADISHTMQHWNTYMKFNQRLFEERYLAWINGHAPKEPSAGWYGGELWFFDNYIIPLAKKLNKCGVFGASYDEFLTYALENRREWEEKGKEIVPGFLKQCQEKYGTQPAVEPMDVGPSRRMIERLESGERDRLVL